MSTHTTDDFRNARFATHPDGRIAARMDPGSVQTWITSDGTPEHDFWWCSDMTMANDGWSPLDETRLPRVVTDEMVQRYQDEETKWRLEGGPSHPSVARHLLTAALSAAPTTDEDDTSVDCHAMWFKAEKDREKAEKARDAWETNAEALAEDRDTWRERADKAEAFAALWKETARRLALELENAGWIREGVAEHLDALGVRAPEDTEKENDR